MNGILRWMANNHVAANLLMLILVLGGLIMAPKIKQEVFPEVSLDRVIVSVAYPGAGPEEVEEGIILKIEESLTAVDTIKQIKATAAEGIGTVTAEIYSDEDVDLALQDIRSEIDRITTFPEQAEQPIVSKLSNRSEVISVVVYGAADEHVLREQAERMRDELLELEDITQVDLSGVRPYEITLEVSEETLRRYGLSLEQVAAAVRAASVDLPGGSVRSAGGEILLRTKERRYSGQQYEDIVILSAPGGGDVTLGEIATVIDGFADGDSWARFNGQPAAMVRIYRIGDQKPTELAERINRYVEEQQEHLPASLHLATWNDTSEIFTDRMQLLQKNALLGLLLIIVILGLFLEIRLAAWVMLGIPISFFGTLLVMPAFDVSINMVSLFAFILALGIIVDDAIVVGENIYAHRQKGKKYNTAAIDGVCEVATPVIFSILTTVAAFSPLLLVSGMLGKLISVIPLVVITLLLMSLIESLLVLPAHLSGGGPRERSRGLLGRIDRVRQTVGRAMENFTNGPYQRLLNANLNHRYVSLAIGVVALLLTVGLLQNGLVKFSFMPDIDGDWILVDVTMNQGVPIEETDQVIQHLVESGHETVAEFDRTGQKDESALRYIYALVGQSFASRGPVGTLTSSTSSHLGTVALLLCESDKRDFSASEFSDQWRQKLGDPPGVDSIVFKSNLISVGANIDIALAHDDFSVLEKALQRVNTALSMYEGVSDIDDTYDRGKREIVLTLTPQGRSLGIREEDLARQVRAAFYGAEALRIQRGRNEVKVMVRYPLEQRRHLYSFEHMRIRTPDGGELPLLQAAHISEGLGFAQINRTERKRVINITARVDGKMAVAQEIIADLETSLLPQLTADYPGLSWDLEGEEKERKEALASMMDGFKLALLAIFALLAIPFRSYSQPLLIMVAIPFGMVGAVLGHIIMGYNLSMLSLFGLVALAGVVVNDSLLLIDRINRNRRSGLPLRAAVLTSARERLRPIVLTSLTTFFGLFPMILETSIQARFLIPMAISLGFGILFGTIIILLLIPALYLILEDIRSLLGFEPHISETMEN